MAWQRKLPRATDADWIAGRISKGGRANGLLGIDVEEGHGGTANVTMTIGSARRGGKTPVTLDVAVSEDPISPKRIYVKLRCREEVEIPKYKLPNEADPKAAAGQAAANAAPKTVDVKAEESLFEKEFVLAPGQNLAANSKIKFEGEIEFPGHLPPSFNGKFARVKWDALGGVAAGLNHPDTGWQEIAVA